MPSRGAPDRTPLTRVRLLTDGLATWALTEEGAVWGSLVRAKVRRLGGQLGRSGGKVLFPPGQGSAHRCPPPLGFLTALQAQLPPGSLLPPRDCGLPRALCLSTWRGPSSPGRLQYIRRRSVFFCYSSLNPSEQGPAPSSGVSRNIFSD